MLNRKQFVTKLQDFLKKENINPDDVWVSFGGALLLMGFKETTGDIDLNATKEVCDRLMKKYHHYELDDGITLISVTDHIDMHNGYNRPEELVLSEEGIWYTDIFHTLKGYQYLNREKDQGWIKVLEKAVKDYDKSIMYKTRELAEKAEMSLGTTNLLERMKQYAVPFDEVKIPLYHLSFKDSLEGKVLKPQLAENIHNLDDVDETNYGLFELAPNRLSCAPTLEQCYYALFGTIVHLAKVIYPDADVFEAWLYQVVPTDRTRVLTNETIVGNRLIHDAHVTGEYGVVNTFQLKRLRKVKFKALREYDREKGVWFHPFNEKNGEKWFLAMDPILV